MSSSEKQSALKDHTLPQKASWCLLRRRLCRRWARSDAYPGCMHSPAGHHTIAQAARRRQELGQSSWLSPAVLQAPAKITTTNPRRRLLVVSRVNLLIGN